MADAPKALRWHAQQQGVGATVVSLGSWSKILGPGLRLGWIEAEPELLKRLAADGEVRCGSVWGCAEGARSGASGSVPWDEVPARARLPCDW